MVYMEYGINGKKPNMSRGCVWRLDGKEPEQKWRGRDLAVRRQKFGGFVGLFTCCAVFKVVHHIPFHTGHLE